MDGSWSELFSSDYRGVVAILAGGVAMYATNEFVTMSLMPSIVADIGGARMYAWVTTVYLIASVVAAATVGPTLITFGPRTSYAGALLAFAVGSVVCTLAPGMPALLGGRVIQGLAGGILAGLGYAVIAAAMPERLWTRASAVVSAMWGLGTVVGPAAGGLFAQFGSWRGAFGLLVVAAMLTALAVPFALPARSSRPVPALPIPVRSLTLLGAAALVVSLAAVSVRLTTTVALLLLAVALVVLFVIADRRGGAAVLPRATFGPGPLKWIYLTLGLLMAATMIDMYVPLLGQRVGALSPLLAGFLGAALSVGWTAAEIGSASIARRRTAARVVAAAPLVMAAGFGLAALAGGGSAATTGVAVWAAALVVAGAGIGAAWPHLSAWAMSGAADPGQQAVAAAAITTVQLICGAFGAGLAGVLANLRDQPDSGLARAMFAAFAGLAAVGSVVAVRAARPPLR